MPAPTAAASVESRPLRPGLTRRVRGAQLPDPGPGRDDARADEPPPRSADDVRALLTRFRDGVARGEQETGGRSPEPPSSLANEGDRS
jgi:hypothetical protein